MLFRRVLKHTNSKLSWDLRLAIKGKAGIEKAVLFLT